MKTEDIDLMIILLSLAGGGSERFALNLLSSSAMKTVKYKLVTCKKDIDYSLPPSIFENYVTLNAKKTPFAIPKIIWTIRKYQPKNILILSHRPAELLPFIKPFISKKINIFVRIQNVPSKLSKKKTMQLYHQKLFRWFQKKNIKMICQCRYMENDLIGFAKLSNKKNIFMIHNPVVERFTEECPTLLNDSITLKLLYVGRLDLSKGLDRLFDALSKIKRPWNLTILGQGPEEKIFRAQAIKLKIADKIIWVGFSEPNNFYCQHHALVLPSRFEGFPNVALEATAAGRPVIAFDSPGGSSESLGYPQCSRRGILVPDGDIEAYAKAIEEFDFKQFDPEMTKSLTLKEFGQEKICGIYRQALTQGTT